jgi:PfaB family protein
MKRHPIAVVGFAGIFPEADTVEQFWQNIIHKKNAVADVPESRWVAPPDFIYHSKPMPDKALSKRACLIKDFVFDPSGFNFDASLLAGLDPLYHITLHAGRKAFESCITRSLDLKRVGVSLAAIALPTDGSSAITREILTSPPSPLLIGDGSKLSPLSVSGRGKVTSLPGSILAKALGLGGGSFTLDAACASSLYAVKIACDELQSYRADAMLAGGVSRPDCLYTQVGFSQLRALSPSGTCSPFDESADGLVVGEGAGILVLKRLDDAIRDKDQIYAVIRGIGLSNDMRGNLLAPEVRGQVRAMEMAYESAGWSPEMVDLIECHGTGTPAGDMTELQSLRTLWGESGWREKQCAIGSVKSMIGHLLTGAGAAGMIKTLLAMQHKILPPSLNFRKASDNSPLHHSPFRVQTEPEEWIQRNADTPRRAGVSAFGFGGINGHILFEEIQPNPPSPFPAREWVASHQEGAEVESPLSVSGRGRGWGLAEVAIVGISTAFGQLNSLQEFQQAIFNGESAIRKRPEDRWKGADEAIPDGRAAYGAYMDDVSLNVGEFSIPPNEIPDILPQQLLMLKIAAKAMQDANLPMKAERPRMGVIIGTEFDYEACNFSLRWSQHNQPEKHGHPLTASRTLGALGGIVASRIAREFRFGGPSFIVSGEEIAGLKALEIGVRSLQQNETDAVLVGAIDLSGDVRNVLINSSLRTFSKETYIRPFDKLADGTLPGDGAVALILKRLDQAIADGDKIYAVIKGMGQASGNDMKEAYQRSLKRAFEDADILPDSVSYIETHGSGDPNEDKIETEALHEFFSDKKESCAIGSSKPIIGHTGAASGLASLVKTALSLYHNIIPPLKNFTEPQDDLWKGIFHIPISPQFWFRNRQDGARRACVGAMTNDGNCCHAILEANPSPKSPPPPFNKGGIERIRLFVVEGDTKQEVLEKLDSLNFALCTLHFALTKKYVLSIVAADEAQLQKWIEEAKQAVIQDMPRKIIGSSGIAYSPNPISGQIAFVFPGSGNHYVGMGRGIGVYFPEIFRQMDAETLELKTQAIPECYMPWRSSWSDGWEKEAYQKIISDPLHAIFGQVVHGGVMSNLIQSFGVKPNAVIGYSLGESAGLFALKAWPERGEMLRRMRDNDLFSTQLAGQCLSARKAWNIPANEEFNWAAAVVNRPAAMVRETLSQFPMTRLLIINTPDECVIGGHKTQIESAIRDMKCEAFFLDGVVTVHCDAAMPVAEAYKNLHVFPVTQPEGIRFYSCALGRAYDLSSENAADSILRQALYGFDFPAAIEQAYQDGVRIFLEMGPQASCTRMIGRILGDKPHLAISACVRGEDDYLTILKFLAALIAERIPVENPPCPPLQKGEVNGAAQKITVNIGGKLPVEISAIPQNEKQFFSTAPSPKQEDEKPYAISEQGESDILTELIQPFAKGIEATAEAHRQFLEFSTELTQNFGKTFEIQAQLIEQMITSEQDGSIDNYPVGIDYNRPEIHFRYAFDRDMCMEFAIGSIANVLGPEFAAVDTYKARVRLPDEPLMLVDRIISVEGEKGSLGSGRLITEHDVLPGAWYLDGNRAPVCISVEAGQADLFLCSYLGIDLRVKGERTYRLLDAKVKFHRGLPQPGDVIRYEIEIEKFVCQGETYLFFFHFEGFIGNEHLISMRDGCAGFFTEEEVRNSGGIILTEEEKKPAAGKKDFKELVPFSAESYDDAAIEALRQGNLEAAFGSAFKGVQIAEWLKLPGGRMNLIDRVLLIDPTGGRYGLGIIRAEADIHPDDWFLTCHFVDDMVMPGTLMYECCAHTLRVFLQRIGWITDKPGVCYEPIIGNESVLKCRGPVTQATKHVIYEVQLKEIGYNPEPYVIADAQMYADGHHIVMFKDMGMKMTGITREEIESFWIARAEIASEKPLYDFDRILAFAIGKPSEAFGEPYKVFDEERKIARLPGPPYAFMHRVTKTEPEPWVLKSGGWIEAEYDLTPEEWYFKADRSGIMPFCVLLEIALQPCGWLAAYVGSALRSKTDLKFRNLGGKAILHKNILPEKQTLTMRSRMTQVSEAGGMIIENFDMQVLRDGEMLYDGDTYFGFFSKEALAQQVGIQGAKEKAYQPTQDELARACSVNFADESPLFPEDVNLTPSPSLAMPAKALRMIDKIEIYVPDGGPHGLGFIRGVKIVNPDEWFFKAHFYQDPVCPGSLGIESFLQLMKFAALDRWKELANTHRFEMVTGKQHNWVYRGQIIQKNKRVEVDAVITQVKEGKNPEIYASGYLKVDGLFIYQMENFGLRLVRI